VHVRRECSCGCCPLERGADIDAKDGTERHSFTHCACRGGHTEITMALIGRVMLVEEHLWLAALIMACVQMVTLGS
jgi:hypothetical protein